MKTFNVLIITNLFLVSLLWASDSRANVILKDDYSREEIFKIQNDKEVIISSFSAREKARIKEKFSNEEENKVIKKVFIDNLYSYLNNRDAHCEVKYISVLIKDLQKINIPSTEDEMLDVFKFLRTANSIDDIFYDILAALVKDFYTLESLDLSTKPQKNIFKNYDKKSKDYNLNELFSSFKNYPDEVESCAYREFIKLREKVGSFKDSKSSKNKDLKDLSYVAFDKKIISVETYNRLKFLANDSTSDKRAIWLNDYFKIIFSAKNRMIPFKRTYKVINLEDESTFSTERVRRFSRITRRKLLFQKYDESQIILLSQVMKKASQRMGVDPDTKTGVPYFVHEYVIEKQSGETQNLVEKIELDTQSQFNLARRLLRKDIVGLQMMKSFQQVNISFEDVVMASLETGYLSLDDIEYVAKYDDLWNPQISKTERIMNMTFRVAGYGTFFLPPPWNVTAALALSIVEGIADSKNIDGASNDNPNTFIE